MKDFAGPSGRLRALPIAAKVLYSAFAVSAVLGMLVSWRLYGSVVRDGGPAAYYSGAVPTLQAAPESPSSGSDGPVLELPDDVREQRVMTEQVSDRKLLEVTHFHLFSIPVYVLILAHLWILTRVPPWLHTAGAIGAVASSAIHLAAPWIVRGRPALTILVPVSAVAMLFTLGVMAVGSLVDMWMPRRRLTGC